MSREILFRGKRIDNGEWIEGSYFIDSECFLKEKEVLKHYIVNEFGKFEVVYPETVGQYTGLDDCTGKRIFEGDIVRNLQGKTAYITFLQQEMGYVAVYGKHDSRIGHRATGSPYDYDDTIEVCGNVHDNPELLVTE